MPSPASFVTSVRSQVDTELPQTPPGRFTEAGEPD